MKTILFIGMFSFLILFPTYDIFAPPSPNEWPAAPYCPMGCPLDYLKQKWAEYYDYKGGQWMEMKKKEMFDAYNNGTLEKWLQPNTSTPNGNVHFYYYLRGEIPDIDGRYVYEAYGQQDWLTLLVSGFDDSVPPTDGKIFKIETSPDIVQSIKIISDEFFDFAGFDIALKQNSTGALEIKIPKNLPTPASFTNSWNYNERPYVDANGTTVMDYDIIEDPCYFHYMIPIEGKTNVEIVYPVILAGTWQLYSPIQFDENDSCYNKVFYEKPHESPLKQFKSGISVNNIICRDNLELIIKESGFDSPACVNPDSKTKLVQRGWAQNITDGTTRELVCGKDFLEWGYGSLVKTTGFLSASPLTTNSQNINNAEIEKSNESKLIQFTLLPNSSGTVTMLYDKPCNSQGFEIKPTLDVLYNFFNSINSDNIGLQKFDESITGLEHIASKKGTNLHIYVSNVENYQNNSVVVQYAVKSSSDTGRYLLSLHRTCPGDLLTIGDKPYSGNLPPYFKGAFYGCR